MKIIFYSKANDRVPVIKDLGFQSPRVAFRQLKGDLAEKLTQAELARRIHTTQSVIARAESGNDSRIPSVDLLMRIASASHMEMNIQFKPQARASVGR